MFCFMFAIMGRVTLINKCLNSMNVKVSNALSIVITAAQNTNNTADQSNIASNSYLLFGQ